MSRARQGSTSVVVLCPWHVERTPSCHLTRRGARLLAYCHGCQEGGSVIDLAAAARGSQLPRDFQEVVRATAELFGVAVDLGPPRPAPRRDPLVDLAERIDEQAERWLRGLKVADQVLDAAPLPSLTAALSLLADLDEERQRRWDALTQRAVAR